MRIKHTSIILSFVAYPAVPHFSTLSHKQHHYRKKITEHKMCVLIFSINLSETCLSLRWIQRYILNLHTSSCEVPFVCMYIHIGFKTFFLVVRHLDSFASYLPIGLHLGLFRSWPSLFLPSSFSSVFLVLSCFGIHFSAILGSLSSAIL